jgi:hypothetical protein
VQDSNLRSRLRRPPLHAAWIVALICGRASFMSLRIAGRSVHVPDLGDLGVSVRRPACKISVRLVLTSRGAGHGLDPIDRE